MNQNKLINILPITLSKFMQGLSTGLFCCLTFSMPVYSQSAGGGQNTGPLFLLIVIAVYLVPTMLAVKRNHSQKTPIIALNILLGWTILGWVGSLVWSLTNTRTEPTVAPATSDADELEKLHALKEKGIITDADYQQKKSKLI